VHVCEAGGGELRWSALDEWTMMWAPVISSVLPVVPLAWPAGWEDVEVVDSVLVEESPAVDVPEVAGATYNRFARVAENERYGRLVSVLA